MKKTIRGLILLGCAMLMLKTGVWAQAPEFNIALTITIVDRLAVNGDIMSLSDDNIRLNRSKIPYDTQMYGVLVENPQIVYRTSSDMPISRSGNAMVNVTNLDGPIKIGDFITSSEIPGKGQKGGDQGGYMVGIALAPFDGTKGEIINYKGQQYRQGQILTAIGVGPASPVLIKAIGGIMGTLRQLIQAIIYNIGVSRLLDRFIRYVIAALVAVTAIYISFRSWGRNVNKGIEAIGRNPLAKASIQAMIVLNIVLIVIVSLAGVVLALVIISL